jgi:hypothetical protein
MEHLSAPCPRWGGLLEVGVSPKQCCRAAASVGPGLLWASIGLALSCVALHPAGLHADSGESWVVRAVAWRVTSSATRQALTGLSQSAASEGVAAAAGAVGPPAEESVEQLLVELDRQRDRVLDSRESSEARARSLERWLVLVERIEHRACCVTTEWQATPAPQGGSWRAALERIEAALPRGPSEAEAAYRERVVRQLLADYPEVERPRAPGALGDSEAAEKPREAESSSCGSGLGKAAAEGCGAEDVVLAGYRMALLIEESFGSCRSGAPGEDPVCLPYVGPTPSACWRALPMDWPVSQRTD